MSSRRLLALTIALVAAVTVGTLAAVRDDQRPDPAPPRAEELPPPAEGNGGAAAPGRVEGAALPATLVAGDRALLPLPDDGLRSVLDTPVQGDALTVLGITKQGFFAGAGELSRVFVFWQQDPPVVDTQIDLTGTIRAAPSDPRTQLGLDAGDAAAVAAAGGYIVAEEVNAAG